jgi:hypothetical protein
MQAAQISEQMKDKLWSNVEKTSTCWFWRGRCVNNKGYASIWHGRRSFGVHRISYTLAKGEIPEGLCVLHKCDVPLCVNPDHLFLGTQLDNIRDCEQKGRLKLPPRQRGAESPSARLTEIQARNICALHAAGYSTPHLGRMFGVSTSCVGHMVSGRTWKMTPKFKRLSLPSWLKLQVAANRRPGVVLR